MSMPPDFGDDILVRTRLLAPRLPRRWLPRERLHRILSAVVEYPLTTVQASAGYGKSAALAAFAGLSPNPVSWLNVEGCEDPVVFVVHLVHACRAFSPSAGARSLDILQHGGSQAWTQSLDSLINELVNDATGDVVLILDDYHTVGDLIEIRTLIERLIALRPPQLHLVLASRRQPLLTLLPALRARGELLEIGERELAFTPDEIALLFGTAYGHELSPAAAQGMSEQTGGWPIALQLVWQNLQISPGGSGERSDHSSEDPLLSTHSPALKEWGREALFAYLAREVFARQPDGVQDFLLRTSVLPDLRPAACDYLLSVKDSTHRLEALYRQGLFLTALGGGAYRYHPLFHEFLRERAAALPGWKELHLRAAHYYRREGAGEQVLHHLMAVGDAAEAAEELERLAQSWLENGRLVTLLSWIDHFPVEITEKHPQLLIARGDAARLLLRFDLAQEAYKQAREIYRTLGDHAGEARALRGWAMIYADTMQPKRAEAELRRAFRLLPAGHAARAEVLGLIVESWVDQGRAAKALRFADWRVPGNPSAGISKVGRARALVRMGRLDEAGAVLQADVPEDHATKPGQGASKARCEAALLSSLIRALEGDGEGALRCALEALDTARLSGYTLLEAQGHIRAGHSVQLARPDDYRASLEHYLQALALASAAHVEAAGAEAYMGMALLHGFQGNVIAAEEAAREGLRLSEASGDEWLTAQLWTTMAAVATANLSTEADTWLQGALARQRDCKDAYGQAVSKLWLAVKHHRAGETETAGSRAVEVFEMAQRHGFQSLLVRPSLFGPRDRMMLAMVLMAAHKEPAWREPAQALLKRGFPAIAAATDTASDSAGAYHPGVTLRVQTLGPLRVWRGNEEVGPHEWQRKKAPQLLALLITNRERWLLREQICDWLWPDEKAEDAEAQFKVTLNSLNAALEPLRPPRTPPFYIRRRGGAYRFLPPDGVWLDMVEFEELLGKVRSAERDARKPDREAASQPALYAAHFDELTKAVELYRGEYLSDWLYEDWASDERERIQSLYKEAAALLARAMVERDEPYEAIKLCEGVLALDPGWEAAYGVLMRAYARQHNRRMVVASYERCVRNLREFLDVDPLPSTTQIYNEAKA